MLIDPISAVGLAASVVALIQAANALLNIITKHPQRLRQGRCCGDPLGNAHHRQRLVDTLSEFIRTLGSAGSVSPGASAHTLAELQELRTILESLNEEYYPCQRCPNFMKCIWSCIRSPSVYAKLEEAERRLQNLRTEVIVIEGALVLSSQLPRICNEIIEIPESDVGLDRSEIALEFLLQSQQQELRIIGIYGQPGLGKTTILNRIWEEASSQSPFAARAYVQVGLDPTLATLCKLQSSILEQLGGRKYCFPADVFGRGILNESLQKLKSMNIPVFLALDNVWEPESLEKLLPAKIWSDLPCFSCIALTSRDFTVVKALARICHLQESNESQVLFYSPSFLSPEESKALFIKSASISAGAIEHEMLLQALVPLCGGLPLALTTLGSIFKDEAKRKEKNWRALVKKMKWQDIDQGELPRETSPVMKALELSYEQLQPSHKAAFLDVVHFYYGWPWETVERIVGGDILQDLKDRSLISDAQDFTRCTIQNALGYGFITRIPLFILDYGKFPSLRKVVAMHDLTLRFGGSLHTEAVFQTHENILVMEYFFSLKANQLRSLKLIMGSSNTSTVLEFLKKARNLKMLLLEFNEDGGEQTNHFYLEAGNEYFGASALNSRPCQLRYLRIDRMELGADQLMCSSELREIALRNCKDVVQLPDFPLVHLEQLVMDGCKKFESFSKHVETWYNLQDLEVSYCDSITEVPPQLGSLPKLRRIVFACCPALENFTSVASSSWKCLQELSFLNCAKLRQLPTSLSNATSMRDLLFESRFIDGQYSGILIPPQIWNITSLEMLSLHKCSSLKRLPSSIGNAASLKTLNLRDSHNLLELPQEVANMTSLRELDISFCTSLKKLPDSVCDISSLQSINISCCESIVELPERLGSLTSLTRLDASKCTKLKRLPHSIFCNASSLCELYLQGCDSLMELVPEELSKLKCLRKLDIRLCFGLTQLPQILSQCSSNQELSIQYSN